MKSLRFEEAAPYVQTLGRVYPDEVRKAIWLNWTCTGLRFTFTGRLLKADMLGIAGMNFGIELPYIGITVDGGTELTQRIRVDEGENTYTLLETAKEERHTITIWKLSENARGKCAVRSLYTDGALQPVKTVEPALRLEFVGDSITCGYGNEASGRDAPFKPEEENGFMAFSAMTARILEAKFQCISVSGISVAVDPEGLKIPGLRGMEELYPYTDRLFEELSGEEFFRPWDFARNPVDAVILNLGTNDVNAYKFTNDIGKARGFFQTRYLAFLKTLRRCNGPGTYILCTLGPLDYYLYDEIRDIVEAYISQTGDRQVSCFKFGAVVQWSEGFGAVGHPSLKTHERMSRELSDELNRVFHEGRLL